MESTWEVAFRPRKSHNPQTPSSPKPKKQPKTQKTKVESRNFHKGKSRNLKIQAKRKTQNSCFFKLDFSTKNFSDVLGSLKLNCLFRF
jgi:hypothetical protein